MCHLYSHSPIHIYGVVFNYAQTVKLHEFYSKALVISFKLQSHYLPRERVLGIHWIGGWMGPRDRVAKRKILHLSGIKP
jgi:hypothetical protein